MKIKALAACLLLAGCSGAASTAATHSVQPSPTVSASAGDGIAAFRASAGSIVTAYSSELQSADTAVNRDDFDGLGIAAAQAVKTCAQAIGTAPPTDPEMARLWQQFGTTCLTAWSGIQTGAQSSSIPLVEQAMAQLTATTALVDQMTTRLTALNGG